MRGTIEAEGTGSLLRAAWETHPWGQVGKYFVWLPLLIYLAFVVFLWLDEGFHPLLLLGIAGGCIPYWLVQRRGRKILSESETDLSHLFDRVFGDVILRKSVADHDRH